jgi:hypothetical protein
MEKKMKFDFRNLALLLCTTPFIAAQAPPMPAATQPTAPAATQSSLAQPVYIYLYSRVTDQVNTDITEDRLRRLLPMIERYRTEHPEAHVSATILFSGAASEALAAKNVKTGIKDFVLGYKKRGVIEIGYDGSDEPTYEHRPVVQLKEKATPEQRWLERANADEQFLTQGRNPVTGDPQKGTVGGLKAMQQVFGPAACINAASVGLKRVDPSTDPNMPGHGATASVTPDVGDWEIVPVLRRYNTSAIMFGLPATNPAHIPGFGGSIMGIGRMMSPTTEDSPELFWADNILRSSESGGGGARVLHGYEGVEALTTFTAKLDRSRIRIIHMELGSERDYLKPDFAKTTTLSPALTYAYAHPDSPTLPAEAKLSTAETNAAFANEDAAVKWIIANYFPANAGSRFVSSTELKRMTPASTGYSVSISELQTALQKTLTDWGINTLPPPYLHVGNHYLSLAESFQVMTDALSEMNRTGKLPQSVQVVRVYGPIGMPGGHGPNLGDVSVASVAKVCAQIDARLHDDTANPLPKNTVPSILAVDGIGVNAAQFLRLMAQALVAPTLDAKVRIRMTYMFPGTAEIFPKTRALEDTGATWTFKPAPLDTLSPSTRAMR